MNLIEPEGLGDTPYTFEGDVMRGRHTFFRSHQSRTVCHRGNSYYVENVLRVWIWDPRVLSWGYRLVFWLQWKVICNCHRFRMKCFLKENQDKRVSSNCFRLQAGRGPWGGGVVVLRAEPLCLQPDPIHPPRVLPTPHGFVCGLGE